MIGIRLQHGHHHVALNFRDFRDSGNFLADRRTESDLDLVTWSTRSPRRPRRDQTGPGGRAAGPTVRRNLRISGVSESESPATGRSAAAAALIRSSDPGLTDPTDPEAS